MYGYLLKTRANVFFNFRRLCSEILGRRGGGMGVGVDVGASLSKLCSVLYPPSVSKKMVMVHSRNSFRSRNNFPSFKEVFVEVWWCSVRATVDG